jgi:transposase
MYLLGTGCQWRAIPKDLPPRSTVHDYFDRWSRDGTVERMHHALYIACRELDGREASPTAAVIDSQSVKSAEKGAHIDPIGYDAGKKIKGIKRHILTDSTDFLLHAIVHAADIQDRDGGAMLMATLFGLFPFLTKLYADGGYQGPIFQEAMQSIMSEVNIEIVKRSDHAKGFVLLPKRWVVERTLAWLNRCRRLAKHRECRARKARAFLLLVSIRLVVRRLGRG